MSIRSWRFLVLLLAALGLILGGAHLLELPPKMRYDGAMYAAVNSTLYPLFAMVGGPIQIGAILSSTVLAYRAHGHTGGRWALWGCLALFLSFGLWLALVVPVNSEWARVMEAAPASAPEAYLRLRDRWEYGHVAAFLAWLMGFILLLVSVLVETPSDRSEH
jgi:hypothetical protein